MKAFWQSGLARSFRRDRAAQFAFAVFAAFAFAAVFAGILAPYNPYNPLEIDLLDSETPPVWSEGGELRFILGTDAQGRDLLSAILYGLRISIIIGVFAVLLQAFLGVAIGLISGYAGGRVDAALMRAADIQLSFSPFMAAIVALALFQALFGAERYEELAIYMLILVIGIAEWPQYARTVRAVVLAEKEKDYIAAARALGYPPLRIILRHLFPNTLTPVLVISTVQTANAIITEASLSFLGLGMPVTRPSLGSLIHAGFEHIFSGEWWLIFFPSAALVFLILSANMLGDFLRDELNPRRNPS
ncbi:MAG: ABC transporter permease [Gammaproteobacteria bacterium]